MGMQIGEAGVDVCLADIDLVDTRRRRVPTLQPLVDQRPVESHPTGEVLLAVGSRHRYDVALNLKHCGPQASEVLQDLGGGGLRRRQWWRMKSRCPSRHGDLRVIERW